MRYEVKSWQGAESSTPGVGIIQIPDDAEHVDVEYSERNGQTVAKARYLVPAES